MSVRDSKIEEELELKKAEMEVLISQRNYVISKLHESKALEPVVARLIRLAKSTNTSASWRIGKKIVDLLHRILFKEVKPGFIEEIKAIELELRGSNVQVQVETELPDAGVDYPAISPPIKVNRRYRNFDFKRDSATRKKLKSYLAGNTHLHDVLVSIVMPTHNRARALPRAIQSVITQKHSNWELLIVDDGSTDTTSELMELYSDQRIIYKKIGKSGVGTARNVALDMANGEVIAFLDSDNEWYSEYLELTVSGIYMNDVPVVYSGLELIQHDETVGYRGDDFDFSACYEGNYVDLNCFAHKKTEFKNHRFDIGLRRYNDWDYILGVTNKQEVKYLPFNGVKYYIESFDDQISLKEPRIFRKVVKSRYKSTVDISDNSSASVENIVSRLKLSFVIRVSPKNSLVPSYDYYSGLGLKHALERNGHSAELYFTSEPIQSDQYDVVLSIQGLDNHEPVIGCLNLIWSIGNPSLLELRSLAGFDLIFVASRSYQKMLELDLGRTVYYLPNAVDRAATYFKSGENKGANKEYLYFGDAGDSQGLAINYALKANLPISIYGSGWVDTVLLELVKASYLSYEQAQDLLDTDSVLLLDQHDKDFEYVDYRAFQALASGALVVAEETSELNTLFSSSILTFDDNTQFQSCIQGVSNRLPALDSRSHSDRIFDLHSYDKRAVQILDAVKGNLANTQEPNSNDLWSIDLDGVASKSLPADTGKATKRAINIGFFPQVTKSAKWSSSAYLRIVQPLTSAGVSGFANIFVFESVEGYLVNQSTEPEVVIISRTAIESVEHAKALRRILEERKVPYVLDLDDGFHLMNETHPEFETYSNRTEALKHLLEGAGDIWCASSALTDSIESYGFKNVITIENSLDPRLWRNTFSKPLRPRQSKVVQLLYMGSHTHEEDLNLILPALDRIAKDKLNSFQLTVIGVSSNLPNRSWLKSKTPPDSETSYPRFSSWMHAQAGLYDIGLAPLVASRFNDLKSDLKVLEYIAIGAIAVASNTSGYAANDMTLLCQTEDDWCETLTRLIGETNSLDFDAGRTSDERNQLWKERTSAGVGNRLLERLNAISES